MSSDLFNFYQNNDFKQNKINVDDNGKNDPNNPNNRIERDIYEEDNDDEPDVIPEYTTFVKEEQPYNKEPSISGYYYYYYHYTYYILLYHHLILSLYILYR